MRALDAPPVADAAGRTVRMAVLAIGGERYGIDLAHLEQVLPYVPATPIPGVAEHWHGLINLRGNLCPVLHLGRYLRVPSAAGAAGSTGSTGSTGATGTGTLAIVSANGVELALLVDEVLEIADIPADRVGPPLFGGRVGTAVRGVTPDMICVLDLEALLSDEAIVVEHQSL